MFNVDINYNKKFLNKIKQNIFINTQNFLNKKEIMIIYI